MFIFPSLPPGTSKVRAVCPRCSHHHDCKLWFVLCVAGLPLSSCSCHPHIWCPLIPSPFPIEWHLNHFSGTLCVTLHDFLVKREHDLGLADNTHLSVCICFFWTLARQLLQTPTASPSAGIGLACEFQVSFPVRELHGRRKTSVNCSYRLMSSLLKHQSSIRCWVFVWGVSTQQQPSPPQTLIVHQISTRIFKI